METARNAYTAEELTDVCNLLLKMRDACKAGVHVCDSLRAEKVKALDIALEAIGMMPDWSNHAK